MPTYAYKCRDCGRTLEAQQAFTDAALTECPYCGGTLRKQYGTVGVTFNGSGFYRTDSRAKPSGSDGGSGGSDGKSGDTGGSGSGPGPEKKSDGGGKTDAKPPAAPAKPAASTPAS